MILFDFGVIVRDLFIFDFINTDCTKFWLFSINRVCKLNFQKQNDMM